MFQRSRTLILLFTLAIVSPGALAFAQPGIDSPQVDSIIMRGMELVYADRNSEGVEEFKKLINLFPDNPIGYFYVSASLQTVMDDYRNYADMDEFNKYMDLAIEKGERIKEEGNLTAYDWFYFGGAIGFRGIHKALTGNWMGAFVDGLKGKGYLEKALELDPEMYDVYYGLGSYHFWKSLKSRVFWWLPFVSDNRQMGIDMIMQAIEKGKYSRKDAKLALVRIWVENKEYDKAFAMIDELEKIYPNKPFLLWLQAQAQMENSMYDEALGTYQKLLAALTASPYYHPAGEVECRYLMARVLYEKKDYRESYAQLKTLLALEDDAGDNKVVRDFLREAKKLKKRIQREANIG
jgi:tetratricopeptide (TPR) repeat protein